MNWLAALIADIAVKVIALLGGDLLDYLKKKNDAETFQKVINKAAQQSVIPLQNAKTGQEIDDASKDAFDGV